MATRRKDWPTLNYDEWRETGAALHLWSQIVGTYRLASTPWVNHAWHATLYVTPRRADAPAWSRTDPAR